MVIPSRGASNNPPNRFERLIVECEEPIDRNPRTQFFREPARSIISTNDSPDIGFSASLNPYRGCEHGCPYCYARPYHEYLGFSSGLDFETRIIVKENAPELLREELTSTRWEPKALAMSGVTDCYQPIEKRLEVTRRCLQVLVEFRNPVGVITKNHLVTRDADLLGELAKINACAVYMTITTLDAGLARRMEPRASSPNHRLDAIQRLAAAHIPVGVLIAPVIPGLTEHEIPAILKTARDAGASRAAYSILRLPYAVKDIFIKWVEENFPGHQDKILRRIRDLRGNTLNSSTFGERLRGQGFWAEQIQALFNKCREKEGFSTERFPYNTAAFQRPPSAQLAFF